MCVMCHLADTPIGKGNVESWLRYYSTYPTQSCSGVILPYNHTGNFDRYTIGRDADTTRDMDYYNLPGDDDNTNMPTF
jgi:hypothetical protein